MDVYNYMGDVIINTVTMYILLFFYRPLMMDKLSLKWANKIMVDNTENVLKLLYCNLDICIKESRDICPS